MQRPRIMNRRYKDEHGFKFRICEGLILFYISTNDELEMEDDYETYISKEVFDTRSEALKKARETLEMEKRDALEEYLTYVEDQVIVPYGEYGEDNSNGFAFYENGNLAKRSERGHKYITLAFPDNNMGSWYEEFEVNITNRTTYNDFLKSIKTQLEKEIDHPYIEIVKV